jgi:hypothetical protein
VITTGINTGIGTLGGGNHFIEIGKCEDSAKSYWIVIHSRKKMSNEHKPIDACLAPLVRALSRGGVYPANCCCGHGSGMSEIILHDGRRLRVVGREEAPDGSE